MSIEIAPLKQQGYSKVIQFAIEGMNFTQYFSSNTFPIDFF